MSKSWTMQHRTHSRPLLAVAAVVLLGFNDTNAEPRLPQLPATSRGSAVVNETAAPNLDTAAGDIPGRLPTNTTKIMLTPGCLGVIAVTTILVLSYVLMSIVFERSGKKRDRTVKNPDVFVQEASGQNWIGDPVAMQGHVEAALERERFMSIDCLSLYFNRPWRQELGPEFIVPTVCSNVEWMGRERFPAGCINKRRGSRGVLIMSLATWKFFWRRTASTRKCLTLHVVEGMCPAASSVILSILVAMLSQMPGMHQSTNRYVLLVLGYGLIQIIEDRCHYIYEIDIPGASVRHELRHRLQYEFLQLQKIDPEAWPAGRCVAILDGEVDSLVNNVWESMFQMAKQMMRLVSLVATVFWHLRNARGIQITLGAVYLLLAYGIINNVIAREPNLVDMAKRKRDWAFAMFSVATHQVHDSRQGLWRGSDGQDTLENVTFFGKVSMIYRKRAFHFYFVRLMSALVNKEMMTLAQTAVMAILGAEVIEGRMSAGGVVGTFSAMASLMATFESFNATWLNLIQGFPSLLCIAHIFNRGAGFADDAADFKEDFSDKTSDNDINDEELGSDSINSGKSDP